jgi:hypothetical protein
VPKIQYVARNFSASSRTIIDQANTIIAEYNAQGYDLTLRQLYYQFVSRDLLSNTQESYKRLGSIINDARLAGEIDWNHIEDRTRGVEALATWSDPADIVSACASQFRLDLWATQSYRPEVWIEKEALAGVFERVCNELRVPYLSCRGYTSQSEMWRARRWLARSQKAGQKPVIFHFGDHDPSGIDMSRDIRDRLKTFMGGVKFERLALNMDQVEEYEPPPNPAKMQDARAAIYVEEYGDESWELDALEPAVLVQLVDEAVHAIRDDDLWQEAADREDEARRLLGAVAEDWQGITEGL